MPFLLLCDCMDVKLEWQEHKHIPPMEQHFMLLTAHTYTLQSNIVKCAYVATFRRAHPLSSDSSVNERMGVLLI